MTPLITNGYVYIAQLHCIRLLKEKLNFMLTMTVSWKDNPREPMEKRRMHNTKVQGSG